MTDVSGFPSGSPSCLLLRLSGNEHRPEPGIWGTSLDPNRPDSYPRKERGLETRRTRDRSVYLPVPVTESDPVTSRRRPTCLLETSMQESNRKYVSLMWVKFIQLQDFRLVGLLTRRRNPVLLSAPLPQNSRRVGRKL